MMLRSYGHTSSWDRKPFDEASRAIAALENRPRLIDSLRKIYENKWIVQFSLGHRFITPNNEADEPDVITTADLTKNVACFGFGAGYFVKKNWLLGAEFDFLPIHKEEHVNNVSIGGGSINVDGSGSGGVMFNLGVLSKFFLPVGEFSRAYLGFKTGVIKAAAGGGEGGFSSSQGQFKEIRVLVRNFGYGNLTLGISHRPTPVVLLDLNAGYLLSSRTDNIGGIESPGGITATFSIQFVIGGAKGL